MLVLFQRKFNFHFGRGLTDNMNATECKKEMTDVMTSEDITDIMTFNDIIDVKTFHALSD